MNKSSLARLTASKRHAAVAFTLLELLVVISIIAVLAGILLPVTASVMESARKTSAKNSEMQIVAAVKSFQTDYGVYPVITETQTGHDTLVNGTNNQDLFNVLRATGIGTDVATSSPNTRRQIYFEGKDVKNSKSPKDGFMPAGTSGTSPTGGTLTAGAFVDPWSNGYYVRYDTGYSDAVLHPYSSDANGVDDDTTSTASPSPFIRTGVIAWSYGKDGMKGNKGTTSGTGTYTYGDDVVSWQ